MSRSRPSLRSSIGSRAFPIRHGTGFCWRSNVSNTIPTGSPAVAANDLVAIGIISTLKRHGRRVPSDISVVGIDDIQMASLLDPPLTTVAQPIYEMGRQGMENILLRIQNPQLETSEIMFETRLTIRQSTAKRPVKKTHPQTMETQKTLSNLTRRQFLHNS